MILATSLIFAVFNFHNFFTTESAGDASCWSTDRFIPYDIIDIFYAMDRFVYSYMPCILIGIINIAIIHKFVKAKLTSKNEGTESTNQALSNVAMRGISILIGVSDVHSINCTTP